MRIVITSDTHGNFRSLRQAVLCQPQADAVIHLGDGADDVEDIKSEFPHLTILQVRGNCDPHSPFPTEAIFDVSGVKILYTHGHLYDVKSTLLYLRDAAQSKNAQVALFGHTHVPLAEYQDGLYLMNPGSLSFPGGSYGILDITKAGIAANIITI